MPSPLGLCPDNAPAGCPVSEPRPHAGQTTTFPPHTEAVWRNQQRSEVDLTSPEKGKVAGAGAESVPHSLERGIPSRKHRPSQVLGYRPLPYTPSPGGRSRVGGRCSEAAWGLEAHLDTGTWALL